MIQNGWIGDNGDPENVEESDISRQTGDVFILASQVSNEECGSVHESLLHYVNSVDVIKIDANRVTQAGSGCAQLLVAASRSAGVLGKPFQLVGASQALANTFRDLGLENRIEEWTSVS